MSNISDAINPEISQYIRNLAMMREDRTLAKLRKETNELPEAIMQISIEQGRLMSLLVKMLGAKMALEVGTFTGYSSLCVAEALPSDGKLIACDLSDEWTSIAKKYWQEAGVADRVELHLGPASDSLQKLIDNGRSNTFDFAFIDADKVTYDDYYEKCLALLRPGGAMTIDNMFLHGRVLQPTADAPETGVVHNMTKKIFNDPRVQPAMIPIGDGLLLAMKCQ